MSASVSSRQGSASAGPMPGQSSADDAAREQAAALFQQMLGTSADPATLAAEQRALAGGASPQDLRRLVAHSDAAKAAINGFYRGVLGVDADPQALANVQQALGAGQSLAQAEAAMRPQFAQSATAQASIQALYQGMLGRAATGQEVADRQADLAGGQSLAGLRGPLSRTSEAAGDVQQLYQTVLGRAASDGEVLDREADLAGGQSMAGLRGSLAKTGEAAKDVGFLFSTELGRTAQAGDLAAWQGQLAQGASLAGVGQAFAGSDDAAGQIGSIYQSVLGRAAGAPELADRRADLAGGAGLAGLRRSLSRTGEAVAGIQALYAGVLGRQAGDGEVADRQADLAGGQSLAGLRDGLAKTGEAASGIQGVFGRVLGRAPDAAELSAWQGALAGGGAKMADVAPAVAKSEVNRFYQDLFGRDATQGEVTGFTSAVAAGQTLTSQFARLRPAFATSASETGIIQQFYAQTFGVDAGKTDISRDVAAIEAALSAGQSLGAIEDSLTPAPVRQLKAAYRQDLGRDAGWPELQFWEGKLAAGLALPDALTDIARSQESTAHVQALFQQHFGRFAGVLEVQGFQDGEAAAAPAGAKYQVLRPQSDGGSDVLASVDARTLVGEAAVYVGLAGGLAPELAGPDGQVRSFRNGYEFAAYALGLASRAGTADAGAWATGKLTAGWLDQVGQADIQAASALGARAAADQAAGRAQDAFLEALGAQLAAKIQQQAPGGRGPQSVSVTVGQFTYDVTVTGDAQDPAGLAGFRGSVTDNDPERTRLVAKAQAEAAQGVADGAAGNQLLATLDNAQARVDAALASLPPGARSDRMLTVAQRFVDAGQAAAGAGNWNLVQTLETAADLSIQIAAQPEGSRHALTERFTHEKVKHDITVDPNAADPFASFKDHSKGEDLAGAIVEGVAGVVINVLAVVPSPLQLVTIPAAVAWDAAQAGKSFSQGNIMGGFLSLASAAGVGLSELQAFAQAAGAAGFADVAGAANDALDFTNAIAGSLGFTGLPATAATATTAAQAAVSATAQLGQTVQAAVALVGGAQGIAQSAGKGDPLGIAAGALEVAAAIAGGLVSTQALKNDPVLAQLAAGVRNYGGAAAAAVSAADAFKTGNLAGGLQTSLNALLPLIAEQVGSRFAPAGPGAGGGSSVVPVSKEDLPPVDGYGYDGKPLPEPPVPPGQVPPPTAGGPGSVNGPANTAPAPAQPSAPAIPPSNTSPATPPVAGAGPAIPAQPSNPGSPGSPFDGAGVDGSHFAPVGPFADTPTAPAQPSAPVGTTPATTPPDAPPGSTSPGGGAFDGPAGPTAPGQAGMTGSEPPPVPPPATSPTQGQQNADAVQDGVDRRQGTGPDAGGQVAQNAAPGSQSDVAPALPGLDQLPVDGTGTRPPASLGVGAAGGSAGDPLASGTVRYALPDGAGPQAAVIAGQSAEGGFFLQGGGYVGPAWVTGWDGPQPATLAPDLSNLPRIVVAGGPDSAAAAAPGSEGATGTGTPEAPSTTAPSLGGAAPPSTQPGTGQSGWLGTAGSFFKGAGEGVVDGVVGMVQGVGTLAQDAYSLATSADARQQAMSTLTQDAEAVGGAWDRVSTAYQQAAAEGRGAEFIGKVFGQGAVLVVGTAVIPGGAEAKAAGLAGDAARVAELANDLGKAGEVGADVGKMADARAGLSTVVDGANSAGTASNAGDAATATAGEAPKGARGRSAIVSSILTKLAVPSSPSRWTT